MVNIQGNFKVKGGSGGGISAPSTPSITNKTSSGFTASWDAVTGALGYRLDVATDSGFTSFVTGYNSKAVSGTSEVVTGLSQNTTYYVRVRAVAASSSSSASSETTSETTLLNPSLTSGLQAFYKLDDVNDASGNGNDLTNNGSVSFSSGKIGNAATFDGSNYLSIDSGSSPFGTGDFSVNCWVNATNLDNSQKMVFIGGNGGFGFSLLENTLHLSKPGVADLYDFTSVASIANNSYVHIVITRSANIFTAYINGNSIGTYDSNSTIDFNGTALYLGAYIGGGYNLSGQIDAVGIWNRALTSSEVAELYNSGNGLE